MSIIPIGIGGAFGALARYYLTQGLFNSWGKAFPIGILSVNVIGSFFIGLLTVFFLEILPISIFWRQLIIVGFLGAFTTFSTFSLDTIQLMQQGFYFKAISYVILSVTLSLGGTALGMILIKWIP